MCSLNNETHTTKERKKHGIHNSSSSSNQQQQLRSVQHIKISSKNTIRSTEWKFLWIHDTLYSLYAMSIAYVSLNHVKMAISKHSVFSMLLAYFLSLFLDFSLFIFSFFCFVYTNVHFSKVSLSVIFDYIVSFFVCLQF